MHLVYAAPVLPGWQQYDKLDLSHSRRADYCDSMEELALALRSVALSARRMTGGQTRQISPKGVKVDASLEPSTI